MVSTFLYFFPLEARLLEQRGYILSDHPTESTQWTYGAPVKLAEHSQTKIWLLPLACGQVEPVKLNLKIILYIMNKLKTNVKAAVCNFRRNVFNRDVPLFEMFYLLVAFLSYQLEEIKPCALHADLMCVHGLWPWMNGFHTVLVFKASLMLQIPWSDCIL